EERHLALRVEHALEHVHVDGVLEVALVGLDHERHLGEAQVVLQQVLAQVAQALGVRAQARGGGAGDEHHAVDAAKDQLARGVVEHLARHRVEVEARLEAVDLAQVEGQEVEEQRALVLGGERHHLALRLGRHLLVDLLEVGGLTRQAGAVVDDLEVDLAGGEVDGAHRSLVPNRPSSSAVAPSWNSASKSTSGGASVAFSSSTRMASAACLVATLTRPSCAVESNTVTSSASAPSSSR